MDGEKEVNEGDYFFGAVLAECRHPRRQPISKNPTTQYHVVNLHRLIVCILQTLLGTL